MLVTIDTLRADRVGAYGAATGATPTLDALAARGVRFGTAIAPTPLTLPSHATLLTALDPPQHGVRGNGSFVLPRELPTLAERMRAAGFATAAFVSAFVLDRRFGLARGFDHYDDALGVQGSDPGVAARTADRSVDAALAWLAGAPERFFLWLHLYDPHAPYEPPEPYRTQRLGQPYEGEIAFADAELGRLLAAIDARFGADGSAVIVTSDHGESLGEHGEATHAFTVYDATQRVPLLIAGPGLPRGAVVPAVVRLADLAPTLLELAGADGLGSASGRSLLALARGEPEVEPRVAWVETLATQLDFGWSPLLGVRTRDHKYVRAPRPELYELASDPGELRNLASERPELAAELDALVATRDGGRNVSLNLGGDPQTLERLRSLGYVVTEVDVVSARPLGVVGGLDPKDEIGKLATIREAVTLLEQGRGEDALEQLAALGDLGLEVELLRGEAALAAGDVERARAAAERARRLLPRYAPCHVLLGRVAEAEGRLAEAEAAFRRALDLDPEIGEAWIGLGRLAEARGQWDEARARYEQAHRLARVVAEGLWRLAALELESGHSERARAVLSELPQRLARAPEAAARLARAERRVGRPDLAELRLRGSLREYPDATDLLLVEAELLADQGHKAASLAVLRKAHAASPGSASARLALARGLGLEGSELELALELAETAAAQRRSREALEVLALVRTARREFAEALRLADEGLMTASVALRANLLLRRAEALAGLSRPEAAREALAEARLAAGADPRFEREAARVARRLSADRS